jgi:hypothetical protein
MIMMHTQNIIHTDQNICPIQHAIIRTQFSLHPKIMISATGLPTQMLHAFSKMVPERHISRLQTAKRPHNECTLTSVISKLWTKYGPNLLSDWRSQVGILNISHPGSR